TTNNEDLMGAFLSKSKPTDTNTNTAYKLNKITNTSSQTSNKESWANLTEQENP
ncbi:11084_t:CDS:1, partial [Dentiscutata heterogama]